MSVGGEWATPSAYLPQTYSNKKLLKYLENFSTVLHQTLTGLAWDRPSARFSLLVNYLRVISNESYLPLSGMGDTRG